MKEEHLYELLSALAFEARLAYEVLNDGNLETDLDTRYPAFRDAIAEADKALLKK